MDQRIRGGLRALVGAVVVAIALSGCTGSDEPPASGPTPTSPTSSERPEAAIAVQVGTVTGRLPAQKRRRVADQVAQVVDGWYDAAYLGGDRPKAGPAWAAAWPGFTRGAAAQARRDADLTSDPKSSGSRVEPRTRGVRVDVLAVRQRPVGATAHVFLRYPSGDRTVRVTGRLYLTPTPQGWRVFGYDVTKGAAR